MTLADAATRALRWVREAPVLSYDTETSGVDWKRNHPIGYVFAVDGDAPIYIPVRHAGGGNLLDPACPPLTNPEGPFTTHQFERDLAAAFAARDVGGHMTIGHNLKFDIHFSANAGVMLNRRVECTQLNEALLYEHAPSFSLDSCATRHGVTAKKGQPLYDHLARLFGGAPTRDQMQHFWRTAGNDPVVVDYAAGDGVSTLELWRSQHDQRSREPVDLSRVWALENDLIRTIFRLERRGMAVSGERCDSVRNMLESEVEAILRQLPEGFNPRSPTEVKALCERAGRTDWPMTAPSQRFPNGQPSFTEKWLASFPEGKLVVDLREATNLVNSFLKPLTERHVFQGRVHPSLHQTATDDYGTISGRFSCSNPNMQQVPKHNKKLGKLFRSVFVPDPGMTLFEGDYSQCEPRLFAHYSREPALVDGYSSSPPRDMHRVAADMLNVDRDTVAKRMNMGLLTGMQERTFAAHMGWDMGKATDLFRQWMRAFPGIPGFQQQAKRAMLERGYVFTLLGRVCRLDDPRFAYKATSRIIQGGNADIVKYKLLEADRMLEADGDRVQLLMTIHDSYVWQGVMDEQGERAVRDLVALFTNVQAEPFNLRVPFKMDVGRGADWAQATYGGKS